MMKVLSPGSILMNLQCLQAAAYRLLLACCVPDVGCLYHVAEDLHPSKRKKAIMLGLGSL